MARVLVVGDIHEPVSHPGYLSFCRDLHDAWDCDSVVLIGDVVDWGAISFHTKHPEIPGPLDEFELARAQIRKWYRAFPQARVCLGNHDYRPIRVAAANGIPAGLLRDFKGLWQTPGWSWKDDHIVDHVYYFHGTGVGGIHPAYNSMQKMLMSTVQGHIHQAAGVKWCANPHQRIFGMDTGCGIDDKAAAFAYGQALRRRSMLSAGVVLDGVPYHEIMPCGRGEKYHRSKFAPKRRKRR